MGKSAESGASHRVTERESRLPCVRGGGKTEGFDGRVVSATGDSVYTEL